jgi:intermediate cleaving peptidase 55
MLLYSTGKDSSKEKWDGAFTRFRDVLGLFGADEARPLENFADDLRAFAARAENVYVDAPSHRRAGKTRGLLRYLSRQQPRAARSDPDAYLDAIATSKRRPLTPLVGALRSVKSMHEVEVMKASADISARAHAKVGRASSFVSRLLMTFYLAAVDDALGAAWVVRG